MEVKNAPEKMNGTQEMESPEMGGLSLAPPAFQLMASGGGGVVQRQEATPTPEGTAEPTPIQVPDSYRDPIANSNTSVDNIRQIIAAWEANDPNRDDRKLAYMLATTEHETAGTMHGIHEGFSDNYWRGDYADDGYWGRGFVQLTWEDNYEGMEEQTGVDLTEYPEAALLPAISAEVTANGMMDGDFTSRALNTYIPVTDNGDGTTTQGAANWTGARSVVNGDGLNFGPAAEGILTSIRAFRTGAADGTITVDLATYLMEETDHFESARAADANRALEALGYMEFSTRGFGDDATAEQERYTEDVRQTGYAFDINHMTAVATAALKRFQQDFNRDHNLVTPLNEDGVLDDATWKALVQAGRIPAGNNMIDYAFHGEVTAIDPVGQAWADYAAGTLTLEALAERLVGLMPVPNAQTVLDMFTNAGANAGELAYQLSVMAPTHDQLAYFNPSIREMMYNILNTSTEERHRGMAQRLVDLNAYTQPTLPYLVYTVPAGRFMGQIAEELGTTVEELQAFNNLHNPDGQIVNANNIREGQQIRYPNPAYDSSAQASTPADVANYLPPQPQ